MISAIEWVPAGVADPTPKKYEFSQAELELIEMMKDHNVNDLQDVQAHLKQQEAAKRKEKKKKVKSDPVENTLPADLRMDEYSSDEDDDNENGAQIGQLLVEDVDLEEEGDDAMEDDNDKEDMADDDSDEDDSDDDLANVPDTREYTPVDLEGLNSIGLSQIGTNAPAYMGGDDDDDQNDDDSDADDVIIQPDDAIVVVAKTEDDFAALEVHVYEPDTGNLFVHHDIPLPAFPLCLAHGDIGPTGGAGNFCAVGTFGTGIEVWNLDVLNALEPSCILGGEDTSMADEIMRHNILNSSAKKDKTFKLQPRGTGLKEGSHTDAIMSLSWNKVHRQVIASGSADYTVKLWDVTQANTYQENAATMTHNKDKVQSVLWHPQEGTLLATGSYDRTVALVDARNAENVKRVKIPADCEALAWDPFNPQYLTAASEDGTVQCWDVRNFSDKTPVWSMVASEFGGVSDLSYNSHVPGMLATCSVDKTVTLWDTYNAEKKLSGGPPTAKMNKDMRVGKLYTVGFYPSSPWLLGCGGGAKEMALWDMTREENVQKCFGGRSSLVPSTPLPADGGSNEKQKAFDDMMTSTAEPSESIKDTEKLSSKNKKKGKKKKKVHRAGR